MGLENSLYAERSRGANERNEQRFSMIADAAFTGVFKDHKDMQHALDEISDQIM